MKLLDTSKKDGFEHGAAAIGDDLHEFTNKLVDMVMIPPDVRALISAAPKRSVHLFHNHTNETPHSTLDLEKLLNNSVDRVSVVTYSGSAYSVYVGEGEIPTVEEFRDAAKIIAVEIDTYMRNFIGFNEWTLSERNYVGIREKAYRITRHFKWTMEGGILK